MTSFANLCKLKYKDQAIWFLNGFWKDGVDGNNANEIWDYVKKFIELDMMSMERKGADGNELDQFWSAKFLEDLNSTLTSSERKDALRKIDQDNNGKMSCIEYLVWKFNKGVEETVNAPQGDNSAAIAAAQKKLDAVNEQLLDCENKIAAQKKAIQENDEAIRELKKKQDDLERAKQELVKAEAELQAAVDALHAEEAALENKKKALEATSQKPGVAGAKAKNELAQLLGEDPLPLRKAKITQEAAVRLVKKQQDAVEAAKAEAAAQEKALAEKQRQLEEAKRQLEQAYADLENKMEEARQELEAVKAKPGGGKGAIWWMERELFEADKRLPQAKQKYDHKKPFFFNP
eukprot:CAMPEP_0177661030 /NCGR_PEP_ID=MMETSP0447-20121125/18409_1 /TAXON_ID=0 /ORGANISM="Stygamoeba regulata, Strain BSH-02190019" /LENGTH=347 /DNA_ID=CAMNT_0019166241 /DNA_START=46 /DNA_END=1089 /DNA_ORIENTATION=-